MRVLLMTAVAEFGLVSAADAIGNSGDWCDTGVCCTPRQPEWF